MRNITPGVKHSPFLGAQRGGLALSRNRYDTADRVVKAAGDGSWEAIRSLSPVLGSCRSPGFSRKPPFRNKCPQLYGFRLCTSHSSLRRARGYVGVPIECLPIGPPLLWWSRKCSSSIVRALISGKGNDWAVGAFRATGTIPLKPITCEIR